MKIIKQSILRALALATLALFTFSSCATVTSNYQSKDSRLVTVEHTKKGKVYKRDGETFKPRYSNQGLVEAVTPNAEAKDYAEQGVKKLKLSRTLSYSALGALVAGVALALAGHSKDNWAMKGTGIGIEVGALALAFAALVPDNHAKHLFQNAINKYNDDVLSQINAENSKPLK